MLRGVQRKYCFQSGFRKQHRSMLSKMLKTLPKKGCNRPLSLETSLKRLAPEFAKNY